MREVDPLPRDDRVGGIVGKAPRAFRAAIGADFHCGSRSGLTPPGYQYDLGGEREEWALWQRALWDAYERIAKAVQPVDLFIGLGDLTDGRGRRSGGVEQLEADRKLQVSMAVRAVKQLQARRHMLISGTPYHVSSDGEDYDALLADYLPRADALGTHQYVNVRGVILHLKHFVSSSIIPHGRMTAPAREAMWTELLASRKDFPRADLILRGHVHYHVKAGCRAWEAHTMPCMQGETLFPRNHGMNDIDIGLAVLEVTGRGNWRLSYEWIEVPRARPSVVTV